MTTPLTASRVLTTNGSSQLAASSVTTTELGYVSGVTSAIQTQLNAKYGSGSNVSFGTGAFSGAVSMAGLTATTGSFSSSVTATQFNVSSDLRKKTDIYGITGALDLVSKLDGVRFTYKDSHKKSIGFIAQEVEQVLPELVHQDEEGFRSVNYGQFVALLVEAVKELKAEVDRLKEQR